MAGGDFKTRFQTNGTATRLTEIEVKDVGVNLVAQHNRFFVDDPNNATGIEGHFFNPVKASATTEEEKAAKVVVEWKSGDEDKLSYRKLHYDDLFDDEPSGAAKTNPSDLQFIPLTYLKNGDGDGKYELYVIAYGFAADSCFGLTDQVDVDLNTIGILRITANVDTNNSSKLIVYKFKFEEQDDQTIIEFVLNHSGGKSKGVVRVEDVDPKPLKSLD